MKLHDLYDIMDGSESDNLDRYSESFLNEMSDMLKQIVDDIYGELLLRENKDE